MAGERARKAAERAREWWNAQPNTYGETDYQALADYAAATIEQCAQIADNEDSGWEDADVNCAQRIAAAIRSIANEGAKDGLD